MMFVTVFLAFLCAIASAMPVNVGRTIMTRDVWTPRVLSPSVGTVWRVGERQNVTWYVRSFMPLLLKR